MRLSKRAVAFPAGVFALVLPFAGVQGPQGETQDTFKRHSPLVVETVFPAGDPRRWKRIKSMDHFAAGSPIGLAAWPKVLGKEISIPEWYALGKYTCDGVSLREEVRHGGNEWGEPGLRISELRHIVAADRSEKYEVTLEATLFNPKGNGDRIVTLVYEILDADKEVITTAQREYKLVARAKSGENADVVLLFTQGEMSRVAGLRISITTKPY